MIIFEEDSVLRILRNLGDIKLDSFHDRLRLQKLAYLAQELGAGKECPYSWYIYGPYSSSLTSTLFLGVELEKFDSKPILTKSESKVVSKLKSLLGNKISNPSKLELFASIWYLLPARRISKDDKSALLSVMCKEKPYFKKSEVESALGSILDFKKNF